MGQCASCGKPSTSTDVDNSKKMKKLKKRNGTIVKKNRAENIEKEIIVDAQSKQNENAEDDQVVNMLEVSGETTNIKAGSPQTQTS